jgi:hypothetical protein
MYSTVFQKMKNLAIFLLFFAFFQKTSAQVCVELGIANQTIVSGSNLQFDIFLRTVTPPSTGDLYLGNADFVITFNAGSFTSPTLSKVGGSPGSNTFTPTDPSGLNVLFTQDAYFNRISPAPISGSELIINHADPAPADQTTFDTRIARINDSPLTHRLGRYQISGLTGSIAGANLQWKTSGVGLITKVFTLGNTSPFVSTITNICSALVLPLELTRFTVSPNGEQLDLQWASQRERNFEGFEIERAARVPADFEALGFVPGNGGEAGGQYRYADKAVEPGTTYYYRLKMKDLDGSFSYSDIRSGRIAGQANTVSLYPNPAQDLLYFEWNEVEPLRMEVLDMNGRQLLVLDALDAPIQQLNIAALPAGSYMLRILSMDKRWHELRFVK